MDGNYFNGADLKITDDEFNQVKISNLPNRPNSVSTYGGAALLAKDLKEKYDAPTNMFKNKFNALVDEISKVQGPASAERKRQENEQKRQQNEDERQEYYESLDECLEQLKELQDKMIKAGANGSMILTTALDAYPVGSVYMSLGAKSPAELFGGTWERLKDRFLLGAGDTYTAGSVGGSATHKLDSTKYLPGGAIAVAQNLTGEVVTSIGGTKWSSASYNDNEYVITTRRIGAGLEKAQYEQPINHMPPYLAVYMWKRVA